MNNFATGVTIFSSSNEAVSIPYFTAHLHLYPSDYDALMWRGRAYRITGQKPKALSDFAKASRLTTDPRKSLAEAMFERTLEKNHKCREILSTATRKYPHFAEAWYDLGMDYFYDKENDPGHQMASHCLTRAIQLGESQGAVKQPWYSFANNFMGDVSFDAGQVVSALHYYKRCVQSSQFVAIGHLGMCNCYLEMKDFTRAQASFRIARQLNEVLVPWSSLDEYRPVAAKLKKLRPRGGKSNHSYSWRDDFAKWMDIQTKSPRSPKKDRKVHVQPVDGKTWYIRGITSYTGSSLRPK